MSIERHTQFRLLTENAAELHADYDPDANEFLISLEKNSGMSWTFDKKAIEEAIQFFIVLNGFLKEAK